ncbi:MAG TPA: 2-oxoacid:acceptor oxidoreductase family protein, partial [Candidatus Dojkabacteria bacterium]|nr:2-oxoacid:acceptor oxidoreductase family protein [Candidatus Dojkabacteria bacterium]
MSLTRYSIKIAGQSGQGINTVGIIISKILNSIGYTTFSYREYPSVIKGGVASYQIDFSDKKINSSSRYCNLLCSLDKNALEEYLPSLQKDGIVIHNLKDYTKGILVDSKQIISELKAPEIMENTVMIAFICKILNIKQNIVEKHILEYFKEKKVDPELEKKCIEKGYNIEYTKKIKLPSVPFRITPKKIFNGNEALALGAISCGVRAYYAYPMTPITAIFKHMQEYGTEKGVLLKQAENEITAILMALGSMHMGTRALVATSGGGFDLMTETISCSGMTETPLVVILGQRAGASTGVPTWSGSSDLNIAVKAGHGEYPKAVLAVSDIESSYTLIQKAFNLAEKYQIPVIVLTEKQITESLFTVNKLPNNIPVRRYLSNMTFRYNITDSGISPRRIPTFDEQPYLSSSDEHNEKGESTENSKEIKQMSEKRMRKMKSLEKEFPQPILFNPHKSKTILVGWGSVKNTILDLISQGQDIGYLHYEYLFPLKTELLNTLIK